MANNDQNGLIDPNDTYTSSIRWIRADKVPLSGLWNKNDLLSSYRPNKDFVSMIRMNNLWVNNNSALIVNPDLTTIDLCNRFKSQHIAQIKKTSLVKGNVYVELEHVGLRFFSASNLTKLGLEAQTQIYQIILELMHYFYDNGVFIYPKLDNLLLYIGATFDYLQLNDLSDVREIIWIPDASQVSYEWVSETEYVNRNAFLFTTLNMLNQPFLIGKDIGQLAAENPRAWEQVKPIVNFGTHGINTLRTMISSLASNRFRDFNPQIANLVTLSNEQPKRYQKDSMITNLVELVNVLMKNYGNMPIAYFFAAIEMFFTMAYEVNEIIDLYKGFWDLSVGKEVDTTNYINIIADTQGRLFSNPIYAYSHDLGQIDIAYMQVICNNPELYIKTDFKKWFAGMPRSATSKNVTIKQFFQ